MVTSEGPGHADMEIAGSNGCEMSINWGLDLLKQAVTRMRPIEAAAAPLGADYACYDLEQAPMCFDFLPWLLDREMERVRENAPAPLKIAFTSPPPSRLVLEDHRLMFYNVMLPMLDMVGAVLDQRAAKARKQIDFYCFRPVVEAVRNGEAIPLLKPWGVAVKQAMKIVAGRPPITITLREAFHTPYRDSNKEAWIRFARELRDAGERVVFLRDTSKADEPLEDFETCPDASRNIHLRLALYEQSKCNLFVPNGPMTIALCSTAPWLMVGTVTDDIQDCPVNTATWTDFHAVAPGEQFPWSRSNQRIVWEHDDYENIRAAWDEFSPKLKLAAAA